MSAHLDRPFSMLQGLVWFRKGVISPSLRTRPSGYDEPPSRGGFVSQSGSAYVSEHHSLGFLEEEAPVIGFRGVDDR